MEIPTTNILKGPACLAALAQPLLAQRRLHVDTSLLEARWLLVPPYSIPASSAHSPDSDLPCAKRHPEFSRWHTFLLKYRWDIKLLQFYVLILVWPLVICVIKQLSWSQHLQCEGLYWGLYPPPFSLIFTETLWLSLTFLFSYEVQEA